VIQVPEKEVLRYLGYQGSEANEQVLNEIKCLTNELKENINPKNIYNIYDCTVNSPDVKIGNMTINSSSLAEHLDGCSKVILMAVTLGVEADTIIRKYNVQNMQKALITGVICSVMVENYCNLSEKEAVNQSALFPVKRYSPGYGNFAITYQKDILRQLDCSKHIGLTMTNGYMLTPVKSVTAVIGLTHQQKNTEEKCGKCTNLQCNIREIH